MTLTTSALARFSQCGHRYWLTDVEGVDNPATTRMAVSRAVRAAVQQDLLQNAPSRPRETAPWIGGLSQGEMARVALTPQEAARGMKTTTDRVAYSATRLYGLWRAVVKPRIHHTHLGRGFELGIGGATITGAIEIQEAGGVRSTKVRTRRPEKEESTRDVGLILQAIAAGAERVTTDYLIESDKLAVDRQEWSLSDAQVEMARERVKAAVKAIEVGVFLPADTSDWRCVSCPLHALCRYV
jgi:CRISPR/Cas system-associated exonuclease Cas4 (RecB family)